MAIRVRFQSFEFDLDSGELWKEKAAVRLQPQPAKVLRLLVERAGSLVTREEIQKSLWQGETFVDFDQGLNYCIRQIRVALEDSAEQPAFVETIPRRGYRFRAEVQAVERPPSAMTLEVPAVVAASTPLPAAVPAGRWRMPRGRAIAVSVAILAVVSATLYFGVFRRHQVEASDYDRRAGLHFPRPVQPRPSVAVLGFSNLNGQREDAWLSTALSEMVSTELSAGGKLRLVSAEEIARLAPGSISYDSLSEETLRKLHRELDADVVVTGAYASIAQGEQRKIRLDLRVQDTHRGETLLALAQTGDSNSLFDLVSGTGIKLRDRLGVGGISAEDEAAVQGALPQDPRAQRLYAQGLQKLYAFDTLAGRDLLTQAVAITPNFAQAHAALSAAWSTLGYDVKAAEEAQRALELATTLPREEHLSIEGRYYALSKNWAKAAETLQALVSFFPDNLDYGLRLAVAQFNNRHPDEAMATLAGLRRLPWPQGENPRIDLTEAPLRGQRGEFKEQLRLAESAIRKGRELNEPLLAGQALWMRAWALERLGQLDPSIATSEEAKKTYTEAGDRRGLAITHQLSGDVLYDKGDFEGARQQFTAALGIFQDLGNAGGESRTLERIGNSYYDQGNLAEARRYYERALAKDREISSDASIASDTGNLANVLESMGDLKGALRLNQEALRAFHASGQKRGEGSTDDNIGNLYVVTGDLDAASQAFRESLALQKETGYQRGQGYATTGLGDVALSRNDLDGAQRSYQQALDIFKRTGEENLVAQTQLGLSQVAYYQQHWSQAEGLLRDSIPIFEKGKDLDSQSYAHAWLTRILLVQGKREPAATAARRALELSATASDRSKFEAALAMARAEAALGNKTDAARRLRTALASATKSGNQLYAFELRLALSEVDGSARDLAQLQADASRKGFALVANQARTLASSKR